MHTIKHVIVSDSVINGFGNLCFSVVLVKNYGFSVKVLRKVFYGIWKNILSTHFQDPALRGLGMNPMACSPAENSLSTARTQGDASYGVVWHRQEKVTVHLQLQDKGVYWNKTDHTNQKGQEQARGQDFNTL